jgi:hypothetical protein
LPQQEPAESDKRRHNATRKSIFRACRQTVSFPPSPKSVHDPAQLCTPTHEKNGANPKNGGDTQRQPSAKIDIPTLSPPSPKPAESDKRRHNATRKSIFQACRQTVFLPPSPKSVHNLAQLCTPTHEKNGANPKHGGERNANPARRSTSRLCPRPARNQRRATKGDTMQHENPFFRSVAKPSASPQPEIQGRGRDAGCPAPPAQIRTSGIPAYGSYLGCIASNRN